MVTFNLLPWHTQKLIYERRIVKRMMLISACLLIVFSGIVHSVLQIETKRLEVSINYLKQSVRNLISDPINIHIGQEINLYQQFNRVILNLSNQFNNHLVCLNEVTRQKNKIVFSGQTNSALDLTSFLHTWSAMKEFREVNIQEMHHLPNQSMQFRFNATQNSYLPQKMKENSDNDDI